MSKPPNRAELWPAHGPCYLCGTVGPLCRSHIIPKFVGDWQRRTNLTGRLRTSNAPNKLVEDLEWRYMPCASCEGRFSEFESDVCERIFLPIHERTQDRFRYGPSFARFAVSVVWRAIVKFGREGGLGRLTEIPADVEVAERVWREFLLEGRRTPAPHVGRVTVGRADKLEHQGTFPALCPLLAPNSGACDTMRRRRWVCDCQDGSSARDWRRG